MPCYSLDKRNSLYFNLFLNYTFIFQAFTMSTYFKKGKNIYQICFKIWHYFLIGEAYILGHASATQCILHTHCQP